MSGERRTRLILVFATLVALAVIAGVALRFHRAHLRGTTGIAFHGEMKFSGPEARLVSLFNFGSLKSGAVISAREGTPAYRGGIRAGDEIRTINGIAIRETEKLRFLDRQLSEGDQVVYVASRNDNLITARAKLESPFRHSVTVFQVALYVFCAAAFILISLLVLWRRPGSRRALVFFFLCVAGGGFFVLMALSQIELRLDRGILHAQASSGRSAMIGFAFGLVALAVETLLLHLTLLFPNERPIVRSTPTIFRWVHLSPFFPIFLSIFFFTALGAANSVLYRILAPLSAILVLAALVIDRRANSEQSWFRFFSLRPLRTFLILLLGSMAMAAILQLFPRNARIGFVIAFVVFITIATVAAIFAWTGLAILNLIRSYLESGIEERDQIRWPLWGTITAVTISTVTSVSAYLVFRFEPQLLSYNSSQIAVTALTSLSYVLIPMTFAFAILKYRLLDIDLVIRRTLSYSVLSGITLVIYIGLVFLLGNLVVTWFGAKNQTAIIVATLAAGLLFIPLRNRIQQSIDRRFARHKYSYPEALRELLTVAQQEGSLETFAQKTVTIVQKALQSRSVVLMVKANAQSSLAPIASVGLPVNAPSLVLDDDSVSTDGDFVRFQPQGALAGAGLHSAFSIVSGGCLVGVLATGAPIGGGELESEDVDFLRGASTHITLALGRLTDSLDESEFQQALEIQQSLLPKNLPTLQGIDLAALWQPARTVGGDYYDVLVFDERHFAICIADVAGKGMPAAMLMSNLQAAVNAIADAGLSPRSVCEKVRKVVKPNLSGGKFVTFFYALFDLDAKTIRYTNAGHNAPILVRADGSAIELDGGGPALARLMTSTPYTDASVEFGSGDRLVLFTDGVTEARSPSGEDFGEASLLAIVRDGTGDARTMRTEILTAIQQFSAGRLQDDVTLVVVRAT